MSQGKSHKIFGIFVFILLILICAYLFLHSSFFAVDKIYVSGSNNVSESEIIKISGLSPGMNIFTINEKLCNQAVAIHPLIKSSTLVRHLPRQVEIQVKERKIWALVPYQGALLCVDNEGICIDKLSHFSMVNYPVITMDKMPEHINLGQAVNDNGIKLAWQIWNGLDANERKEISQFHYQNKSGEVLIYSQGCTEFRWGNAERLEEKIAFFKQMLEIENDMQAKGNNDLVYVDLRFKGQPVVKTVME
ncbi:MAG TPA: FtsQ-type POTRA domain-containing protein [Gelria sp.]|nr:FtsQ-type POTRA domain-containing protein [Gelria sp.]